MPPKNVDSFENVKFVDKSGREVHIGNENEYIFEELEPINDQFSETAEFSAILPIEEAEIIRKELRIDDFERVCQEISWFMEHYILEKSNGAFSDLIKAFILSFPDRKTVHLALHSKRYRIRKKYVDRMIKAYLKEVEKNENL